MKNKRKRRKIRRKKNRFLKIFLPTSCIILALVTVWSISAKHKQDTTETFLPEEEIESPDSTTPTIENDIEVIEKRIDANKDGEFIVCVDPGHGGRDRGSTKWSREECDDNLKIALALQSALEDLGATVIMTRTDDTKVFLSERSEIANDSNADFFISLHRNSGNGNGLETWIKANATELEKRFGSVIHDAIIGVEVSRDRGMKQGSQKSTEEDYKIFTTNIMPSCIVEIGFINSSKDNQLFDENYLDYATAMANNIKELYDDYISGMFKDDNSNDSLDDTNTADEPNESDLPTQPENLDSNSDTSNTEADANQEVSPSQALPQTDGEISLTSLSNEPITWGPGRQMDETNRPIACVSLQEKYGNLNGHFIKNTTEKTIYLTFDEGYENGYTSQILDSLKKKQVHAVFFVTLPYAKSNPDLIRRMIDEGHIVGNHSVTHPSKGLPSQTVVEQKNEIMGLHNYMVENFNYSMSLFRPPAGLFSETSLAVVNNCGYQTVFWSFAYKDYDVDNQPSNQEGLSVTTANLHPGAIFLLHAVSKTNTDILEDFIDATWNAGYSFALL